MKRTRIDEIALLIEKNGKMTLEELGRLFPDVSDMTLRRDLVELENENKVIRVRGGAMSVLEVQKRSGEAYAQKSTINTDAKKVIAKKAVSLIDEGASIFLDGGTTALYLAKELPDQPCHIFTNGIDFLLPQRSDEFKGRPIHHGTGLDNFILRNHGSCPNDAFCSDIGISQ